MPRSVITTITVLSDNTAATAISIQDALNATRKYVAVKYHNVTRLVADSVIAFQHIPTFKQAADILIKAVTRRVRENLDH